MSRSESASPSTTCSSPSPSDRRNAAQPEHRLGFRLRSDGDGAVGQRRGRLPVHARVASSCRDRRRRSSTAGRGPSLPDRRGVVVARTVVGEQQVPRRGGAEDHAAVDHRQALPEQETGPARALPAKRCSALPGSLRCHRRSRDPALDIGHVAASLSLRCGSAPRTGRPARTSLGVPLLAAGEAVRVVVEAEQVDVVHEQPARELDAQGNCTSLCDTGTVIP